MYAARDICEERVTVPTAAGGLDGILAYPFQTSPVSGAVLAGPHPLLGGNVKNNVMRALRHALSAAGAVTLTFDYRTVGTHDPGRRHWSVIASSFWRDGCFEEEVGWVEDLRCAARALRGWCGGRAPVLVGYSFGCWAAAQIVEETAPHAIVLISPNPRQHDFASLAWCDAPLLIVQSDDDFTCGADEGAAWFAALRAPKSRALLTAGAHFFRGSESRLTGTVVAFLREHGLCQTVCG